MSEISGLLKDANELLAASGAASPLTDCYVLLAKACEKDIVFIKAHPEYEPSESEEAVFAETIRLRSEGMPVAYITNEKEFYSLSFYVDTSVLIPRPDTECVVEKALKIGQSMTDELGRDIRVLDLCCGSGCIGIAFAANCKNCSVTLSDINENSVETANINIAAHSLTGRVRALKSDLFDELEGTFDIIISNPPYVTGEEMISLEREVKCEPELALYGGTDGLSFYRGILDECGKHLEAGGAIVFEIGAYQSADVEALMKNAGFTDIETERDLAGLDRCISGRMIR